MEEIAHTIWYSELSNDTIAMFRLLSAIQKGHATIVHVTSSHVTIEAQRYVIDRIRTLEILEGA